MNKEKLEQETESEMEAHAKEQLAEIGAENKRVKAQLETMTKEELIVKILSLQTIEFFLKHQMLNICCCKTCKPTLSDDEEVQFMYDKLIECAVNGLSLAESLHRFDDDKYADIDFWCSLGSNNDK